MAQIFQGIFHLDSKQAIKIKVENKRNSLGICKSIRGKLAGYFLNTNNNAIPLV